MAKIYPENNQKGDEIYELMKCVVYSLLCCVCMCVILIFIIVYSIENNIDGSYSSIS